MNSYRHTAKNGRSGSALAALSFLLALISCVSAGYLYFQWHELYTKNTGFEASRAQLEDQVASLEKDLQSALKEKQEISQTLESAASEKSELAQTIEALKKDLEETQAELSKIKKERESLKKLAVQAKTAVGGAAANGLIADNSSSGTAASALPQVVVTAPAGEAAQPMKIKTINRTFNFVVFDLIPGAVLRPGDSAVVERDGQWISDIKIKQVYAKFASAEIRKESDEKLLQIGDTIRAL